MKENIEVGGSNGLTEKESSEIGAIFQESLKLAYVVDFEVAKSLGFNIAKPLGNGLYVIADLYTESSENWG
jgi:hypothetical protein